jgi:hypothetical protein
VGSGRDRNPKSKPADEVQCAVRGPDSAKREPRRTSARFLRFALRARKAKGTKKALRGAVPADLCPQCNILHWHCDDSGMRCWFDRVVDAHEA